MYAKYMYDADDFRDYVVVNESNILHSVTDDGQPANTKVLRPRPRLPSTVNDYLQCNDPSQDIATYRMFHPTKTAQMFIGECFREHAKIHTSCVCWRESLKFQMQLPEQAV